MNDQNDLLHAARQLLMWNRVLLVLLLVAAGAVGIHLIEDHVKREIYSVRAGWSGDTLVISSIRGRQWITHLTAHSGGRYIGTEFPRPIFLLDSEGAKIDIATLKALHWRNEGGGAEAPPAVGDEVDALYVSLEATKWSPQKPPPTPLP